MRDISLGEVGSTFDSFAHIGPTVSVRVKAFTGATSGRSLGGAMIRSRRRRASDWRFSTSAAMEPAKIAVMTNTIATVIPASINTPRLPGAG
jgi:hypothetical protein